MLTVHFSFSHNGGLVQRTPKRPLLKDQETGMKPFRYEYSMDTQWILY